MAYFTIGLEKSYGVTHIECVEATDLREAKQKWAKKTGHATQYWNPDTQTYRGWRVIEIGTKR